MVRNINDFFPRKSDLGNGPIEVVLGDVLDKVINGGTLLSTRGKPQLDRSIRKMGKVKYCYGDKKTAAN